MMLLGDFNGVKNPFWDRSGLGKIKEKSGGKLPRSFFEILEEHDLMDTWRSFNGTSKEYTFFSNRHKSYSRIDVILTSKLLNTQKKKVEILPKT